MRHLSKLLRKSFNTFTIDLSPENGKLCRFFSSQPPVNPFSKTINILKSDLRDLFKLTTFKSVEMDTIFPEHCDILIVGGGVMASSIAYWLKNRAREGLDIIVLEKDANALLLADDNPAKIEYLKYNNLLGECGLRQQYSLEENVKLSLASADFMRNIKRNLTVKGEEPPDIHFTPAGYLFMADEQSAKRLLENVEVQREAGAQIELIKPEALKERYPWLNTEGIEVAAHGLEKEGWFDPFRLQMAFKRKSHELGVHFLQGEVRQFERSLFESKTGTDDFASYNHVIMELPDGTRRKITFSYMIIAAGAISNDILQLLKIGDGTNQIDLPVFPRKRYEFTFNCGEEIPVLISPVIIDPTGLYIRREGLLGDYVCGISPSDEQEPPTDDLTVDNQYFHDIIWPQVKFRIPSLSSGKLQSGTMGFFDVNAFDENPIIGPHPRFGNVYFATGFGGRAAQQAPAIGRAIMELIIDSGYQTINLKRLEMIRYFESERLNETNIL